MCGRSSSDIIQLNGLIFYTFEYQFNAYADSLYALSHGSNPNAMQTETFVYWCMCLFDFAMKKRFVEGCETASEHLALRYLIKSIPQFHGKHQGQQHGRFTTFLFFVKNVELLVLRLQCYMHSELLNLMMYLQFLYMQGYNIDLNITYFIMIGIPDRLTSILQHSHK